jgi:2,3-bisphosphoglycerate-dependent phosphoglycerate mutase
MGLKRNLVLVRHGQSEWNEKNLFTGWKDPGLTSLGYKEAKNAGQLILNTKINFDCMFTSALKRAQLTGDLILNEIQQPDIPIIQNQALKERDYGSLSGLNKDDARKKWGEDQVHIWRRSYDTPPPDGESLKDTAERVLPYFNEVIMPDVLSNKNILVAAHGNSLRALIMQLDNISEEEIVKLEIPTGAPIHYLFDEDGSISSKEKLYE